MPRNTTLYKIAGADTFRLASTSLVTGEGTNLQNIERKRRSIYKADDGKILLQCDQSGADALIVSYLCKPGNYRNLFLNGIKPHTFLALHLFQKQLELKMERSLKLYCETDIVSLNKLEDWKYIQKIIKDSDYWPAEERYYFIGKKVIHSSSYGMASPTFILDVLTESGGRIVLSKKQGDYYLGFFHELFPEIKQWQRETENILWKNKTLYSLQGYPRYFSTINESMYRDAYADVPQRTVACITHIAVTKLQNFIEETNKPWDILANTHDSYLVQCPENETDIKECSSRMQLFMNQPLTNFRGEQFCMKSGLEAGYNWGPVSDNNPRGMGSVKIS